jgi:glucose/arabinose dehydrogenase
MKKNIFWCLSALLLTVSVSTAPGVATPLGQADLQVADLIGATAPTTSAKRDKTYSQVANNEVGKPLTINLLLSYFPFGSGSFPELSHIGLAAVVPKPALKVAQANLGWPTISLTKVVGGLEQPTHITHAGDLSGRLFVVEQKGRVRIVSNGVLLSQPFLDITNRVSCCGEQGLLSVAFPPNYASKKYFYVNYTNKAGDTVVARYRLTSNPNIANPNSEQIVLSVKQPFPNHNGGQLAFGRDGYLYIGMGDGGSGGDPQNNAQNPASLLGKILRIDVESGVTPYAIPPTNPFIQQAGYLKEIWALGLRNPWRFSFDRLTGDLYIADVGQEVYEEVDFQPASSTGGENYGWRLMEGAHCYNSATCNQSGLVLPVTEYNHSQGCSITGGMVYRGWSYQSLRGIYFYADYCSGRIWGLRRRGQVWRNALLLNTSSFGISSFGEDQAGNLYIANLSTGDIYLIKT